MNTRYIDQVKNIENTRFIVLNSNRFRLSDKEKTNIFMLSEIIQFKQDKLRFIQMKFDMIKKIKRIKIRIVNRE